MIKGWFYSVYSDIHYSQVYSTVFVKKQSLPGNSCPLQQAVLLRMQFQNSDLKLLFRIVFKYYWEDIIFIERILFPVNGVIML